MKFLTLEKEIFGMDISDRSLKLINLRKRGNSVKIVSFNEIEIEPGIIEGGVIKNEEALVKIIKVLCGDVKGKKINTKYVAVSLPEEKSFLQVIQMPKMTDEELQSAIIFEAENYIPLPISEVYLDFQPIVPIGKDQLNHFDVLIVATPKKIVNSYVSCLKKAGLVPYALEVESEAIARALIKNEVSTSPVVLIDFGKNSTVFIVFAGRSIQFTCSIPVSAEQLTDAIASSLEIDTDKAEKLKSKYDLSNVKNDPRSQKIKEAMQPIFEDLIEQIKKYLNFYQGHAFHEHLDSDKKIEKILLCGGGSNLKGLPKFLSEKLEIPVELGNFWTNFSSVKSSGNPILVSQSMRGLEGEIQRDSLSFMTALGLALRGIKNTDD